MLCWLGEHTPLFIFWPLFGHRVRMGVGFAYCDRCSWRDAWR